MFRLFGVMVSRTWPIWLIGWLVVFGVVSAYAPAWNDIAVDREFGFLPEDAPSREGRALFAQAFPEEKQVSNIVIIVSRNEQELKEEDRAFVKDVIKPALYQLAKDQGGFANDMPDKSGSLPIIAAIRMFDDPGYGSLFVSENRRATLVDVELTTELLEHRNWELVSKVEAMIEHWGGEAPSGLNMSLIGSAVVGRDMTRGQEQSASSTELWTSIIVVAILLLIYRAPFLAIIPLFSVFMARQISLKLLAILAQAGYVTLFTGSEIYITVILYGTGVDYCLFLIARFEEERRLGAEWGDALARTLTHIGPALTASAATVIFGIGTMIFADFGKFHHAGILVAISLAISLCVVLTFTASLLRFAGPVAFWPRKIVPVDPNAPEAARDGRIWTWFGGVVARWPGAIWFAATLLLTPLAIGGYLIRDNVDYNFIRRLPLEAPSVVGTRSLQRNFPNGVAGVITVLIESPNLDFLQEDGKGQIELTSLTHALIKEQTSLGLADVRTWARPLGTSWVARQVSGAPLEQIAKGKQQALKYYISQHGKLKGHVTRIELTMLEDPMSRQGLQRLSRLQDAIHAQLYGELRNAKFHYLGVSADMRDLRQVTSGDQLRIQILVVGAVLLILLFLLRRPIVSIYLIASVLFSYFAALGATYWFFWHLDPENFVGLDWKTPLFVFTILVAIGEDYNIFLMTRVAEEQAQHGALKGIRVALVKTGSIITSCGIIMAGTFASLTFGTMEDLQHLGFGLAFGVLVDTFIVRPILVPTFLLFLERIKLTWQIAASLPEDPKRLQEMLHRHEAKSDQRGDSPTPNA